MVQPTTRPGDGGAARPPAVAAPAGFVAPKPKPLSMTRPKEQLPSLITGGLALAVRLATGVFTLGWTPRLLTGDDAAAVGVESGTYGFRLGPVAFRDTSPLLAEAVRPEEPLVLYEYEGSPFCRKKRQTKGQRVSSGRSEAWAWAGACGARAEGLGWAEAGGWRRLGPHASPDHRRRRTSESRSGHFCTATCRSRNSCCGSSLER